MSDVSQYPMPRDPTLYRLAGRDRERGRLRDPDVPPVAPPAVPLIDSREARSDTPPKD